MERASLSLLLLLVACTGGQTVPREGVQGNVVTDTGETGDTVHDGFTPYAFAVTEARFALDMDAVQVTSATETDATGTAVELPISVTVTIADASAAQTGVFNEDNHCTVVLEHPGPLPFAAWTGDAGAWFGFELVDAVGTTDCGALDFPPEWGDDPVAHVTKWNWGAGINPLTQEAIDIMGEGYPPLEPWLVGGGYHWEDLPDFPDSEHADDYADGYIDVGIAIAYELDADGTLVTTAEGEPVALTAEAIQTEEGITGWYEVQVPRLLKPASVLLAQP